MKTFVKLIALLATVVLAGCGNSSQLNSNGIPDKLVIGMYGGDEPGQTKTAMAPIQKYLEKKMGMPVEFIFTTDYTAVIEAMRAKKLQAAEFTPFAYVIATQKPGLIPLVSLGIDGNPALYHSTIFTNPKTGIKTIADLKARAKDVTLCFADPASTSGHLIPRAYLTSIGLNPDNAFKQATFAGSHAASILSVKSGKIDVGCTAKDLSLDKLVREGIVKYSDFVFLWTSPPIANHVMTTRDDVNKDFIKKLTQAYLDMARDDYAAFASYAKLYYPDPSKMSYIAAQDSSYNGLRKIASGIKEFKSK